MAQINDNIIEDQDNYEVELLDPFELNYSYDSFSVYPDIFFNHPNIYNIPKNIITPIPDSNLYNNNNNNTQNIMISNKNEIIIKKN